MGTTPALKKGLNERQLRMIVIGAGLFVGSGVVIRARSDYPHIPVTHVVASPAEELAK